MKNYIFCQHVGTLTIFFDDLLINFFFNNINHTFHFNDTQVIFLPENLCVLLKRFKPLGFSWICLLKMLASIHFRIL